MVRCDGTAVSREYLESVRDDARREADAAMVDALTTLSAVFCAYAEGRTAGSSSPHPSSVTESARTSTSPATVPAGHHSR